VTERPKLADSGPRQQEGKLRGFVSFLRVRTDATATAAAAAGSPWRRIAAAAATTAQQWRRRRATTRTTRATTTARRPTWSRAPTAT
jgi:hypothetical protein